MTLGRPVAAAGSAVTTPFDLSTRQARRWPRPVDRIVESLRTWWSDTCGEPARMCRRPVDDRHVRGVEEWWTSRAQPRSPTTHAGKLHWCKWTAGDRGASGPHLRPQTQTLTEQAQRWVVPKVNSPDGDDEMKKFSFHLPSRLGTTANHRARRHPGVASTTTDVMCHLHARPANPSGDSGRPRVTAVTQEIEQP